MSGSGGGRQQGGRRAPQLCHRLLLQLAPHSDPGVRQPCVLHMHRHPLAGGDGRQHRRARPPHSPRLLRPGRPSAPTNSLWRQPAVLPAASGKQPEGRPALAPASAPAPAAPPLLLPHAPGSWLSYVATLTLVERFFTSSLAISGVLLIHFLPSLLWAPLCGVVADRCGARSCHLVCSPARLAPTLAVSFQVGAHSASAGTPSGLPVSPRVLTCVNSHSIAWTHMPHRPTPARSGWLSLQTPASAVLPHRPPSPAARLRCRAGATACGCCWSPRCSTRS